MPTIAEENRKTLRKAMRVECGFRETADEPTNVTPVNCESAYIGLANLDPGLLPATIMDLGGNGFLNNGEAIPMETDTYSFRYGYISSEAAKADGTFDNPPGLTISASRNWDHITLELRGQYGESQTVLVEPVWSSGQTTVYVESWNPGERVYIVSVYLGKAWIWNNSNLISVNLDLHGINTEVGGELEVSSIEIQAYETTDYTDIIGRIPIGAPIWYSAGYDGDMSELRKFYLSETVSWDDNILTVRGQDATSLIDGTETPIWAEYYSGNAVRFITKRLRDCLDGVDYEEIGAAPVYNVPSEQTTIFASYAPRTIISDFSNVFNDPNYIKIGYIDAGIPRLYFGEMGEDRTIYADEISELNVIVEQAINEIDVDVEDYYYVWNTAIEEVEAQAGKTYFIDLDPPVLLSDIAITPTPTSMERITASRVKFVAAATTTYTLKGWEVFVNLTSGNDPYHVTNSSKGTSKKLDNPFPILNTNIGSLTKLGLPSLLERSNILYEFTYRGDPHIQPRDVLNVEIATWETAYKTVTGLYPALDLYPDVDLYPYATYKKVRKMVKRWETMTVDTVTLEHSQGGGLSSKIRARKGAV